MSVRVDGLDFAWTDRPVLSDVSVRVAPGEVLALIGPNGSGKTTLLRAISGVAGGPDVRARVHLDGTPLADLRPREVARLLAAVEAEVRPPFAFTVREIVELGRTPYRARLGPVGPGDRAAVRRALERTDVLRLADRSVESLSSGERQRVWIALALAQEPRILLLDEPTSHLDLAWQVAVLELVRDLARDGLTVVFSVHDLHLAALFADRVALLDAGRVAVEGDPREVLTEERLASVYGTPVRVLRDAAGRPEAVLPERQGPRTFGDAGDGAAAPA